MSKWCPLTPVYLSTIVMTAMIEKIKQRLKYGKHTQLLEPIEGIQVVEVMFADNTFTRSIYYITELTGGRNPNRVRQI